MRFAAKEAIVKGMGTGFAHGVWIRDVGIVQNSWGKPEVVYSERGAKVRDGLGIGEGHVTLTDEAGLVVAVAVLMRRAPMNTLVFDIETVPDTDLGRRLYGFARSVRRAGGANHVHQAPPGNRQRIPVARAASRGGDLGGDALTGFLKVWSLGDEASSEKD
jgi:hypothetical protein